jgi:uncharacterized membrane protein YbhN (UPF0104 family)
MDGVSTDSPSRPAQPPDLDERPDSQKRADAQGPEQREPAETTQVEVTAHEPPVTVEVVEPPIPTRVRRPADLFRLIVAVVVLVGGVALGAAAVGTSGAVEQDLADAASGLPRLLLTLLSWLSAIGVVLLPFVIGTDLIMRRRPWQLIQALGGAVLGAVLVILLSWAILAGPLDILTPTLTRANAEGRSAPLDIVIVSTVGLITVADVMGRKWVSPLAITVVVATAVTGFLSGSVTAAAIVCSVLLGWAIGLGFRYAFGANSTRPPGTEVAKALVATGIPLSRLELLDANDSGDRRYLGTTDTLPVDVHVIDRDTFGLASGRRLLRVLRLRNGFTRPPALTLRAEIEHRTLMGLLLAQARIPAPRPVSVCEVGPFAAAVTYVEPVGESLAERGDRLDDDDIAEVWRMVRVLQQRRIAHRNLGPNIVMIDEDGRAGLRWGGAGDLAADELALRIDVAQLLTTVALSVGPQRAVRSAVTALGEEAVLRAGPLLQRVAMTRATREALKEHKDLLATLRDEVVALRPSEARIEPVELRRFTLRGVVMVVGIAVAAYIVLPQLAQVDFASVIATAEWRWALASVVCAALTFAGASIALNGAVRIHLNFVKTYMTQLAIAFTGLLAPAAVGNIALNTRYLQTSGLSPAVAGAGVGVAQVAQFCSYFILLLVAGVLAGTGPRASFTPPPALVVAIPVAVILLLGLLAVPRIRGFVFSRIVPPIKAAIPQVLAVFQTPAKLAQLIGGALLLDASFVAALVCATRAFGAETSIPATAVVYFAGAIIGSAVPTPGGLGGIEAAMSAGLIAIGVDSGTAVSSVLLYRLATYWLPIPFGWLSLNHLQRIHAL